MGKFLRLKAEKEGTPYVPPNQQHAQLGVNATSTNQDQLPSQGFLGKNTLLPHSMIGSKTQDPLIRAEAEKKLKEQRNLYQQEFQQSIEEIDRNFQLRKQELIKQNEEEIEAERQK